MLAIETYNKALALEDPDPACFEGLAHSLAMVGRFADACTTMEKGLEMRRQRQDDNQSHLISDYQDLGKWYRQLQQPERAMECLRMALSYDKNDQLTLYNLLLMYLSGDDKSQLDAFLHEPLDPQEDGKPFSRRFGEKLDKLTRELDDRRLFEKLFAVVSSSPDLSKSLLGEMDERIDQAERQGDNLLTAKLQLYKGIAIYHYKVGGPSATETAIPCWDKCLKLNIGWGWNVREQASSLMGSHYFEQARLSVDPADRQVHLERLKVLAEGATPYLITNACAYLASYYRIHGDTIGARQAIRRSIHSALRMLSDDTEDNDFVAWGVLGSALRFCGDELNSRTAYDMALPKGPPEIMNWLLDFPAEPERSLGLELAGMLTTEQIDGSILSDSVNQVLRMLDKRVEEATPLYGFDDNGELEQKEIVPGAEAVRMRLLVRYPRARTYMIFTKTCDGVCGKQPWDFTRDIYTCAFCYNVDFCQSCLDSLKAGESQAMGGANHNCRHDHEWLHLPKWDRETFLRGLEGKVLVGGRVGEEDRRVGAEMVTVGEWLDRLKLEWEYKAE